jgi:hypothetical protein
VYLQYQEGLVGEAALDSYGLGVARYFQNARFEDWWFPGGRGSFDPAFVSFFEAEHDLAP